MIVAFSRTKGGKIRATALLPTDDDKGFYVATIFAHLNIADMIQTSDYHKIVPYRVESFRVTRDPKIFHAEKLTELEMRDLWVKVPAEIGTQKITLHVLDTAIRHLVYWDGIRQCIVIARQVDAESPIEILDEIWNEEDMKQFSRDVYNFSESGRYRHLGFLIGALIRGRDKGLVSYLYRTKLCRVAQVVRK